jgi:hypothetical protein
MQTQAEPYYPTLEQAKANIEKMIKQVGLPDVEYVHYSGYDDPSCHEYYFVLKRKDPRIKDHSKMCVLLTCGVSMPGHAFEGDKVYGRLRKMYVDGGGWLWPYARKHIKEALEGRERG